MMLSGLFVQEFYGQVSNEASYFTMIKHQEEPELPLWLGTYGAGEVLNPC